MTPLEEARASLVAATHAKDPDLVVLYIAAARAVAVRMRAELDAFETVVAAREKELVRLAHGDREQLTIAGAK